jgi:hypothetical protein
LPGRVARYGLLAGGDEDGVPRASSRRFSGGSC